ncbi:MAG: hypothetical protein EZS28_043854, partial [Streblomastix strix]
MSNSLCQSGAREGQQRTPNIKIITKTLPHWVAVERPVICHVYRLAWRPRLDFKGVVHIQGCDRVFWCAPVARWVR